MSPRANHPGIAGVGALGWSNGWLRPTHRGCGLGRPPTGLATDVQRERLQTMEIRASKMHGSRAMPRGSVTTTHNRLRP